MVQRRAILAAGGIRVKLLIALVVVLVVAGGVWWRRRLPAPHRALLGHWRKVRSDRPIVNPEYQGVVSALAGREVFISRSRYWRVTATGAAELRYSVANVNEDEFTLDQCVTNPDGEEMYFHVTFSPDRREMRVSTPVMTPGGIETLTAVYKKIDEKTHP